MDNKKIDNNIIEEIKNMEQEIRNSENPAFRKTTYWHQQAANIETSDQEALLKEMIEYLKRIEAKTTQIEALLIKQNPSFHKGLGY